MSSDLLAVDGLRVRYAGSDRDSVSDVSFSLGASEVVGVVGESGSGKTTVGLATLGLLPAGATAAGSIRFDGTEVVGAKESVLRPLRGRSLSTIVQNPATALNPAFSVGSQLTALLRRHGTRGKAEAHASAVQWLEKVGFTDPERSLRAYPHQLSGGMNQRVVIAMALALSPRLVIADEPTSALDVTVQAAVLTLLRRLISGSGSSMVLITHDLGVVAQMCSRVIVMNGGRIVEAGAVGEIFAAPRDPYTRHLLDSLPERRPASAGRGARPGPRGRETQNPRGYGGRPPGNEVTA
ncbi:MAG TPA: ABC transporter ATP-binding protein [Trebonia sp.]|jgi:ABC-type glutathione transport system ATPase component|nr:ABC transporter ATP-binding protein [Trebonia sp.]